MPISQGKNNGRLTSEGTGGEANKMTQIPEILEIKLKGCAGAWDIKSHAKENLVFVSALAFP